MGRFLAVDVVKTIAITGVLAIHISGPGFYVYETGDINWLINLFFASAVRASVPLFLMCSGALLLEPERELPLRKLYFKNILRIVLSMVIWGMVYKIYHLLELNDFSTASLWQSLKEVLLFNQEYHFYYMHMILAVYILLPVVRVIIKASGKRMTEYALLVWFVLAIVYPTVSYFKPFNLFGGMINQWMINATYGSAGYCMLGYYLKEYPPKNSVNCIFALCGFLIIFFGTYLMSVNTGYLNEMFFSGMSVGCALLAAGIYGFCVRNEEKFKKAGRFTENISRASFCIYIVHVLFLNSASRYSLLNGLLNPAATVLLFTPAVLCLSYFVYFIISKIPVVNKWLI